LGTRYDGHGIAKLQRGAEGPEIIPQERLPAQVGGMRFEPF